MLMIQNHVMISVLILFLVTLIAKFIRGMLITHTFGVSRITDDGETLTATASASVFSNHEARYRLVQELMDHGDRRKDFTDDRFKKRIEEEVSKNKDKAHKAKVKSD